MIVDTFKVNDFTVEIESICCNYCGSKSHTVLFESMDHRYMQTEDTFKVAQCNDCGFVFLNPRPTLESIQAFYPAHFFTGTDTAKKQKKYALELGKLRSKPPGKLLDIGTRNGDFVKYAIDQGWEGEGLENASEAKNPFGITIHRDFSTIPKDTFDAVTSWAVFEHLHDPMHFFQETFRVLKPGGEFVFLVPNFDSPRSKLMEMEDIPRHVIFFTPKTAENFLNKAGLELVEVEQDSSIYWGGHRKYLVYLGLRLLGKRFERRHQGNLWSAYKEGKCSLGELIYLTPFEHLDRLVYRRVSKYFASRGKNGIMIVHARKKQ